MSGLGAMMAGGSRPRGRVQHDHYPTPPQVTQALLQVEGDWLRRLRLDLWEPACGDGQMVEVLRADGFDVVASDVRETACPGADVVDFLQAAPAFAPARGIVTNPPFSLAERFIRHGWERLRSPYMALLLKGTYWHAATRLPLWETCRPARIYPLTWRPDFLGLDRPVMEVAWVVWDRTYPDGRACEVQPLPRPLPPLAVLEGVG